MSDVFKKHKRFVFMTLLQCEKKCCTVLRNIIDVIKMIEARARVIACTWCIIITSQFKWNWNWYSVLSAEQCLVEKSTTSHVAFVECYYHGIMPHHAPGHQKYCGQSSWNVGPQETQECCCVYVVVNFLLQVIFVFLLFLGMVIYADEVETKEKQKLPEIKN